MTKPAPRFSGIYPVAPTPFSPDGAIDMASQLRCIDFLIDAGSDGITILANFSEQFLLDDDERDLLTRRILEHVAGRVPVIVTTTHFSTRVCAARSRRAQEFGAAMVMVMPPYHGATFRVGEAAILDFFRELAGAIDIPVMIQDAPVAGTPLSAALLARIAADVAGVRYFKVEVPGTAAKLRALLDIAGDAVEGPWDGEEAITLLADLDAGATGSITGGGYPELIRPVLVAHREGRRDEAAAAYARVLPLINHENRQCGLLACKALMGAGGVIACEDPRHPLPPLAPAARDELIALARGLDAMVLRWGR